MTPQSVKPLPKRTKFFLFVVALISIEVLCVFLFETLTDWHTQKTIKLIWNEDFASPSQVEQYYREFRQPKMAWQPFTHWRRAPFQGDHINIDHSGLRATWLDPHLKSKAPHTLIQMFGASNLWGTGCQDDFTIPSCLAKELQQSNRSVKILNHGETGYVFSQNVIDLTVNLQQGNIPDIAIFYIGLSDLVAAQNTGTIGTLLNQEHRQQEFNLLKPWRETEAWSLMFENLWQNRALCQLYHKAIDRLWPLPKTKALGPRDPSPFFETMIMTAITRSVTMVDHLAEAYGFYALYYWHPTVFSKAQLSDYELGHRARKKEYLEIALKADALVKAMTHPRFKSMADVFKQRDDTLYVDYSHTNHRGNLIIAQKMADDLKPLIKTFNQP